MNIRRLTAAGAAALVTCVTVACEDIPLLPTWDADFNMPLPSQRIGLLGPFPAAIPPGTSANVSFPPQQEELNDVLGSLIDDKLRAADLVFSYSSTIPLDGADTVFVALSTADLTNPAANKITLPFTLTAASTSFTDTVSINAAGIAMLEAAASADGTIFVQLRGRMTYPGPGVRPITATDSIGVRLALLARIAVSR